LEKVLLLHIDIYTFSCSKRRESSVCEARSARDGRALAKTKRPSVKGKIARMLEAARDKVKPTVPRLIFDGRLENEERKRNFDDDMREREGELRAAWLREEEERRVPGRWTEGDSLGFALRPETTHTRERTTATPTRETIISTPRHAPLMMPQPEFNQPCGETAGGVYKPFGEDGGVASKPFGETAGGVYKPFGEDGGVASKPFGETAGGVYKPFGEAAGGLSKLFGEAAGGLSKPFGEAAGGLSKPFGEAAGGLSKPFGETVSVSSQQSTVATSPSVPGSCGPPYLSYPGHPRHPGD
jgi:hypothetical protein